MEKTVNIEVLSKTEREVGEPLKIGRVGPRHTERDLRVHQKQGIVLSGVRPAL